MVPLKVNTLLEKKLKIDLRELSTAQIKIRKNDYRKSKDYLINKSTV